VSVTIQIMNTTTGVKGAPVTNNVFAANLPGKQFACPVPPGTTGNQATVFYQISYTDPGGNAKQADNSSNPSYGP